MQFGCFTALRSRDITPTSSEAAFAICCSAASPRTSILRRMRRPNEVKKIFRNCRLIGRRFRLAHIHFHDEIIEVATFRSNQPEEPAVEPEVQAAEPGSLMVQPRRGSYRKFRSRLPWLNLLPASLSPKLPERPRPPRMLKTEDGMILRDNVFGTPEEDALRRDFTVNALFYNIADFSVIDYVGGMQDLRAGLIRIIGDPWSGLPKTRSAWCARSGSRRSSDSRSRRTPIALCSS